MSEYEHNNKESQSYSKLENSEAREKMPSSLSSEQVLEQIQTIDKNITVSELNITETNHKLEEVRSSIDLPISEEVPHSVLVSKQRIESLQAQKLEINNPVEKEVTQSSAEVTENTENSETEQSRVWVNYKHDPEYRTEVMDKLTDLNKRYSPRPGDTDNDYGVSFSSREEAGNYGNERDQIYKDFVTKYPAKADAYFEQNEDIKNAIPYWKMPAENNEISNEVLKFKNLYPNVYADRQAWINNRKAFEETEIKKEKLRQSYLKNSEAQGTAFPNWENHVTDNGSATSSELTVEPSIESEIVRPHSLRTEDKTFYHEYESVISHEEISVESEDQIITRIGEQINVDSSVDRKSLSDMDIIDSGIFRTDSSDYESTFAWAETDKIIGRPFAKSQSDGWAHEYSGRTDRIDTIAQEIKKGDKENLEEVFHYNQPNERIQLRAIDGPKGPIYLVDDGTHRVGGAKIAGMKEIPCEIKRIKYPQDMVSKSRSDVIDWQKRIDLRLIDGKVETIKASDGTEYYKLVVEKEVLPWMSMISQNDFIEMSQKYEKLYPGSLDNLPIPRDALVDPIANNFYMSGKWEQWLKKYSKNEPDNNSKREDHENLEHEMQQEAIEILEDPNFHLNIEAKVNIILVLENMKPASEFNVQLSNVENTKQILERMGISYVDLFEENSIYDDESRRDGGTTRFSISKDKTLSQRLSNQRIAERGNNLKADYASLAELYGRDMGYPETAIDAFVNNKTQMKKTDYPEEVINSEVGQLLMRLPLFRKSKDHWQDELKTYQLWMEKIKKRAPRLYESILAIKPS